MCQPSTMFRDKYPLSNSEQLNVFVPRSTCNDHFLMYNLEQSTFVVCVYTISFLDHYAKSTSSVIEIKHFGPLYRLQ